MEKTSRVAAAGGAMGLIRTNLTARGPSYVGRKRSTEDFAAEIKAHLELETDELKREGWSEEQARTQALRGFGNVQSAGAF